MMNLLTKLLTTQDIVIDRESVNKDQLLQNVAQFFEWRHGVYAPLTLASLQARENLGSTGIGHGVAIPHARLKSVDDAVAAFFILPQGIEFDALDGLPVKMVLILLVPAHFNKEHLQMLADVAKLFSEPMFRHKLMHCYSANDIYRTIAEVPA